MLHSFDLLIAFLALAAFVALPFAFVAATAGGLALLDRMTYAIPHHGSHR
jgi:hypothetical protein